MAIRKPRRKLFCSKSLDFLFLIIAYVSADTRHEPKELRIVLLGKSGVGKSSTGNTILRENKFKAEFSYKSVTTVCQRETTEVNERLVTVIDTPGLFGTDGDNDEVNKEIAKSSLMAAPGPHVFLLVLNLSQRLTKEDKEAVKMIQSIFGEQSVTYTMVLITGGDVLGNKSIEQCISEGGSDLMRLIEQCGDRYHLFNNNETRDPTQVTTLLDKIDSMVAVNSGHYSNEMFSQIEKTLNQEEHERILQEKERQLEKEKEELKDKYEAETTRLKKTLIENKHILENTEQKYKMTVESLKIKESDLKEKVKARDVELQDMKRAAEEERESHKNKEQNYETTVNTLKKNKSDLEVKVKTMDVELQDMKRAAEEERNKFKIYMEENKLKDQEEQKRKAVEAEERRALEAKLKQAEEGNIQLKERLQEEKKNSERWEKSLNTMMSEASFMWQGKYHSQEREKEIQEIKNYSFGTAPIKEEDKIQKNDEMLKIEELMRVLELKDHHYKTLTTADFLEVTKPSSNCSDSGMNTVQTFLKKLLMMDSRARYCVTEKYNGPDSSNQESGSTIHPMDLQMAVFHCSDHFLKQLIVTKLSQCQYALPLLVPNPFTSNIEFPLWTFRQIKKSWKTTKAISEEKMIVMAETPMVAFFRLGDVSFSKSQLMNSLISKKHDTFFHRNCPGSIKNRLLMDGVVEIAWYCPSGNETDHFTDCVAFCNLHGDAVNNETQHDVLTKMSTVNICFILDFGQKNHHKGLVKRLFRSSKPLICLLTDNDSPVTKMGEGKYSIGLKERNRYDVCKELQKSIKDCLSMQPKTFQLEDLTKYPEIIADENVELCKQGKETALKMMDLLKDMDLSVVKETYLPCQGKLWHDWSQKNKELHRPHGNNIEMYTSNKKIEMIQIREKQKEKGLSELMKCFINGLSSQDSNGKLYFLKWVEIFLNKETSDALYTLHQRYDETWSNIMDLKKSHDKSEQQKTKTENLLKLSKQLEATSFGLEHILREMGQVFESSQSVKSEKDESEQKSHISFFPKLAAEFILSGYPMELMDGDASHVPLIWVSAVLDELIKKMGDQRVFVLSVLGIQSSGKSTMLNAMFGLQFAVSAGRCTRGAFMQLVRVSEEMKEQLKFDYILIVDTEGLQALELSEMSTRQHDNKLATFVVGIGNLTLINIFGENAAEMQDILQIVVQAFLRMKKVKLNPSCMFVHQNVPDVTAGQKNMEGRRRLQQNLDEMTKLAAKEEFCEIENFSDVISFDIKNDVRYFAQLWEGSPPMASQNPQYTENVDELKRTILSRTSDCSTITLKEFRSRIGDLWNALLCENFVFSFRNTVEIAVYRKLEEKYVTWTWSLRSAVLRIKDKLHTSINNKQLSQVDYSYLVEELNETFTDVKESMKIYFEENQEEREILQQWRGTFETKVNNLHEDLLKQTKKDLDDIISHKQTCKNLDDQRTQYEANLFEKSKELALNLKNKNTDEKELQKHFDLLWRKWVDELTANMPVKQISIAQDIVQILFENYGQCVYKRECEHGKYKNMNTLGDYTKYVKFKNVRWYRNIPKFTSPTLRPEDQDSIRQLILIISEETKSLIQSKQVANKGYSSVYIQEIVSLVSNTVAAHTSSRYELNKSKFSLDISLHVCDIAKTELTELHNKFRESFDPLIYLEKMKPEYYSVFQKCCKGATSTAVFGGLICSQLGESILQSVYNETANNLADEMKSNHPALNGNRSNLEKHILRTLAEEEYFEQFKNYILTPKKHFEDFIKSAVKKYMTTENSKALLQITRLFKNKQQCVITAAETATEEVIKDKGDANMWLEKFLVGLKDKLEYKTEHLSGNNCQDISDFHLITDVVKKEISLITEELNKKIHSLSDLQIEKFRKKPDEILIEHFCQCCWVQCPFCKAVCTNTMKNHDGHDHNIPFHRNCGITGFSYRDTENLSISFCTSAVASDRSFWVADDTFLWKDYRTAGPEYANWSITPDLSELPYWKWFVCRFQKDVENHYNKTFQGSGEIPEEWRKYTKKDAIKSLDKYI